MQTERTAGKAEHVQIESVRERLTCLKSDNMSEVDSNYECGTEFMKMNQRLSSCSCVFRLD